MRRLWERLRHSLWGRPAAMDEELASHIEMQADDFIREGMAPAEARRQARLKFGSMAAVQETYRDEWNLAWMESVRQDVRYAWRGMMRSPGFTAAAVLSLALGIGANTAIFSVVYGVLLRALPYAEPERLYAVREVVPAFGHNSIPVNPLHLQEWRKDCKSIESAALVQTSSFSLVNGGEAEQINGARVEPELFQVTGVQPARGRVFTREERDVVLISDGLWQRRFGADPNVVGRKVEMSGRTFEIIGVLSPTFRLPDGGGMSGFSASGREPEVYQSLVIERSELRPLGNFNYGGLVRLRPGATEAGALAEINTVQTRFPAMAGVKIELKAKLVPVQELIAGPVRSGLLLLLGAVGAVVLIVCVNLANLLVARMASRNRELAIRAALGASRGRQVRQALTESLLLAFLGAVLGIGLAVVGVDALVRLAPVNLPRLDEIRVDGTVLAFGLGLALLTGLGSALLPALLVLRHDPQDGLKASSQATTARLGMRQALIGMEVALSTALLVGAGLLLLSFVRVQGVEKGFEGSHVLAADVTLLHPKYRDSAVRRRFAEQTLERIKALPGVIGAATASALPVRGETWIDPVWAEGDTAPPTSRPMPNNRMVSRDYFAVMGIPMALGETFSAASEQPAGVLSANLAERLWPGQNAVGKRFLGMNGTAYTVVGVVGDVRSELERAPAMIVYYPAWVRPLPSFSFVVRTVESPLGVASHVREAVRAEDPSVPVRAMVTLDQIVDRSMAQRRFQLLLIALFAGMATVIASIGIYGVVAFAVNQRRKELGVRAALGAQPGELVRLVVGQGMRPVVVGLVAGVGLALALGRFLSGLLFGVKASDPATIGGAVLVLFAVGLAACFLPARAAVAAEPMRGLRGD